MLKRRTLPQSKAAEGNKLRGWLTTSAKAAGTIGYKLEKEGEGQTVLARLRPLRKIRPAPVHAPARTRRTPMGWCGACSGACGRTALRRFGRCAGSRGSATGVAAAPAGGSSGGGGRAGDCQSGRYPRVYFSRAQKVHVKVGACGASEGKVSSEKSVANYPFEC